MLTMEQIYHIRFEHREKDKSLRRIAQETGFNFRTVRKYVEREDFNIKKKAIHTRKGKLDPYKETIDKWLTEDLKARPKQRHTAQRVYNRLKEIYQDDFQVSDRAVRAYVAKKKKELSSGSKAYLPLEHKPGESQVDFGECQFIERGIKYDGFYLNLSFPHSNGGYPQLFKAQNQECLCQGLQDIFLHIGGVPREIWFDNLSPVVNAIGKEGARDLNKGFLRFALHYGFSSNFCNPGSGNEKGHVESKVGYHRRNFLVPIPEFNDLTEFNRQLLTLGDQDMKRPHYQKDGSIAELFTQDKEALLPLPKIPFEVGRLEKGKADNYGKVKFDNRIYSTSPEYANSEVWIKAGAHTVEIRDADYHTIVTHPRLYGREKESMRWEPYLDLIAQRPKALKYTGFFDQLPLSLQDYFTECDHKTKKSVLKMLARMVKKSGMDVSTQILQQILHQGIKDPDSIWAYYCRLTMEDSDNLSLKLPPGVPEVKEYHTDISPYDNLLWGGRD